MTIEDQIANLQGAVLGLQEQAQIQEDQAKDQKSALDAAKEKIAEHEATIAALKAAPAPKSMDIVVTPHGQVPSRMPLQPLAR